MSQRHSDLPAQQHVVVPPARKGESVGRGLQYRSPRENAIYPGNIRALRNLIYELTSYVGENEPVSIELVRFVLARLNSRGSNLVTGTNGERQVGSSHPGNELISAGKAPTMDAAAQLSLLRSIADEGDIILPLELCVLRRGETFKQWTARAKRCSIQAARRATGGSLQSAAERLGSRVVVCKPIFIEPSERRTKLFLTGSAIRIAIRKSRLDCSLSVGKNDSKVVLILENGAHHERGAERHTISELSQSGRTPEVNQGTTR